MSDGAGAARHVVVPGPEADWWEASAYQGNPNPAIQFGGWQYASAGLRLVAGLRPRMVVLAARLLLQVERSWTELGEVEVALFEIRGTAFALCDMLNGRREVQVWIQKDTDMDAAISLLLSALGVGEEALSFRWDDGNGYADLP